MKQAKQMSIGDSALTCRPDGRPGSFGRRESVSFLIHQQIPPNAPSDPCGRRLDGISCEVGVAGGRLDLGTPVDGRLRSGGKRLAARRLVPLSTDRPRAAGAGASESSTPGRRASADVVRKDGPPADVAAEEQAQEGPCTRPWISAGAEYTVLSCVEAAAPRSSGLTIAWLLRHDGP